MSAIKGKTYPELRIGSEGDLVTMMQDLLSKFGSSLKVDGKFTNGTKSALKAFQKKNGIEATGICGSKTWAALFKTIDSKAEKPKVENQLTDKEKLDILWEAFCKNAK